MRILTCELVFSMGKVSVLQEGYLTKNTMG